MAAQQAYPPYPHSHYSGNGNNLARSYIPTIMVIAVVGFAVAATWTAAGVYSSYKDEQKTVGQRMDSFERRLDDQGRTLTSIDGTLKRLAKGSWTAEVQSAGR